MHGAGNDYIYVDTFFNNKIDNPAEAARLWSNRHKGIGSDGLVLIGRSSSLEADYTMRIFNADGSEAMMCGNACRCVGKYLYEKRLTTENKIKLRTASGIKMLHLHLSSEGVDSVTVDMGEPTFENGKQFQPQRASLREGVYVSMGNPHYVVFTDDLDAIESEGGELECHPVFPERANIEFAEIRPEGIRVRVWERGSGITMACGTGACAATVVGIIQGHLVSPVVVHLKGGDLRVAWQGDDKPVMMTGPAVFVYEGVIDI
jgi:diaminopimelate epimerase